MATTLNTPLACVNSYTTQDGSNFFLDYSSPKPTDGDYRLLLDEHSATRTRLVLTNTVYCDTYSQVDLTNTVSILYIFLLHISFATNRLRYSCSQCLETTVSTLGRKRHFQSLTMSSSALLWSHRQGLDSSTPSGTETDLPPMNTSWEAEKCTHYL